MVNKEDIIKKLKEKLEPMAYIYAMWLEGADASDTVDEYSDIDIYVDFEDKYEEQAIEIVEKTLGEISEIDYKYVMKHGHPKLRQRIYHLKGSSEYLMIDFCWQLHSRDKKEVVYVNNDNIEAAKVIFDKTGVIRHKDYNGEDYKEYNIKRLVDSKYRYSQHCRVIKYVHRGMYLEAYAYYNKYVLEPLINVLRIIFTPAHADYYLIHISQHIPRREWEKLEYFAQITSLEDVKNKTTEAESWFNELLNVLETNN